MDVAGEDATSIEGHVKVLQDQYRKTQPDARIVEERMRRTFAWRRKEIIGGMTVEDAVNKYPFLKSSSGLYQEIGFLYKSVNLCRHFQESFGNIASSVLQLACGKSLLAKPLIEAREESLVEDHNGIDFKTALLMLLVLFREKLEHFIVLGESDPSSPYPTVQVQETTDWKTVLTRRVTAVIRVDGIEICRASGVDEGVLSAFCAYFVFNLTYPPHLKNTLVFLQRRWVQEMSLIPGNMEGIHICPVQTTKRSGTLSGTLERSGTLGGTLERSSTLGGTLERRDTLVRTLERSDALGGMLERSSTLGWTLDGRDKLGGTEGAEFVIPNIPMKSLMKLAYEPKSPLFTLHIILARERASLDKRDFGSFGGELG
ncbi:uncharacterized protein LOC124399773 [Silurus meridionalis]|uniref:uncharacterized protein LOC124399773 n=1 Tax=Silurus meridionalis TaxID=175797 RepID=UPI001EECD458|nr:uncharacterized protein LOC124399773 [Silurus meridionalis]